MKIRFELTKSETAAISNTVNAIAIAAGKYDLVKEHASDFDATNEVTHYGWGTTHVVETENAAMFEVDIDHTAVEYVLDFVRDRFRGVVATIASLAGVCNSLVMQSTLFGEDCAKFKAEFTKKFTLPCDYKATFYRVNLNDKEIDFSVVSKIDVNGEEEIHYDITRFGDLGYNSSNLDIQTVIKFATVTHVAPIVPKSSDVKDIAEAYSDLLSSWVSEDYRVTSLDNYNSLTMGLGKIGGNN